MAHRGAARAPKPGRPGRTYRRGLVGVIVLTVTAAGCSGGDTTPTAASAATPGPPATPPPVATTLQSPTTAAPARTTTTTTTLPPSPLNGLRVADAETLNRRVMAVKIDNHPRARPQSGLQEAGAVFELLVEGGLTRFIALFHGVDSEYVGPIRSVRPTDPTLLKPLGATMQAAGGQQWILRSVARAGVDLLSDARGSSSTFRISSRGAPHNLYGNTVEMRNRADTSGLPNEPPLPMFVFGPASEATGAAIKITLDWSIGNTVRWVYDRGQYLRYQGGAEHMWLDQEGNTAQVAFDTIIVRVARRFTASPRPGEIGSSVPALDTVGAGAALVFHKGRVVDGTWSRDSIDQPFVLTLDDGKPLVLSPGRIWVNVFPSGRALYWE